MAKQFSRSYTKEHVINPDGTVDFKCSTNDEDWPWLALGSRHPVVIQAQNFWASIGAIMAIGEMEAGQWSALTWTDWQCGDQQSGMAAHGTYGRENIGDTESYLITLFDDADREIAKMHGRGVVFRNRNFEEWRGKAKERAEQEAGIQLQDASFEYASPEMIGIGSRECSLVAQLNSPDQPYVSALVTRDNGLSPGNPMLGGSGDHVNSVHMVEAARQALCLLTDNSVIQIAGGEMEFNRYVELGTPFQLTLQARSDTSALFIVTQLERDCAVITLRSE